VQLPAAPEPPPAPEPERGDIEHFRRLARVQGVEAAANAYTKDELLKMARVNNFTYVNPRARKVDLAHALADFL
jgi:methylglyoxal synthase